MKTPLMICGMMAIVSWTGTARAEEKVVAPAITSVGLFKNGLAMVRATFPVDGPGLYRWEQVPRAVHGSFWIQSDGKISVLSTTRMIETTDKTESPTGVLQKDLAGKNVIISVKSSPPGQAAPIRGTVLPLTARAPEKAWDTNYSSLSGNASYPWLGYLGGYSHPLSPGMVPPNFLILTDDKGARHYVDAASIGEVEVTGPFTPAKQSAEKPVLVFDVQQAPSGGGVVQVTWLAKGLAWMPSYQVDLTDEKTLEIRQGAVVRNEMADLAGTEMQLISGYPNVRFGSVDSPLWQGTGLAAFFQQVNQSGMSAGSVLSNGLSQQMVYSNIGTPGQQSLPLPDGGELGTASDDIHYESIGKRELKTGDSLSLEVATARASYERVVEWVIPDYRDPNGRYRRENDREEKEDDSPWDAVRFDNPFKFPMTTAAAVVMEGGRFRGQSQSGWVNAGQSTCLRITRALTVQTESSEVEEEGQREIVWIGGNDFQRTKVKGRFSLRNYRNKEVTVIVRGEFSGELIEADEKPEKSLRSEGAYSVNPRRKLVWTIKLPAGGEKELNYRYSLLVDR